MYVLKYNLKYALDCEDSSLVSDAEKKQLRKVEYTSKNIARAYWPYLAIDVIGTMMWF